MTAIPLVVVDRIWRVPERPTRIAAEMRTLGHPGLMILDFAMRDQIIEYVKMPPLIQQHPPSTRAAVGLLDRFERGESIATPIDLTTEIRRRSSEPSPYEPLPELEETALNAAADRERVTIVSAARDPADPRRVTATLMIHGVPSDFLAEVLDGEGMVPIVRISTGPRFADMSRTLARAVKRALQEARRGV